MDFMGLDYARVEGTPGWLSKMSNLVMSNPFVSWLAVVDLLLLPACANVRPLR
jgi:hypothetical protein